MGEKLKGRAILYAEILTTLSHRTGVKGLKMPISFVLITEKFFLLTTWKVPPRLTITIFFSCSVLSCNVDIFSSFFNSTLIIRTHHCSSFIFSLFHSLSVSLFSYLTLIISLNLSHFLYIIILFSFLYDTQLSWKNKNLFFLNSFTFKILFIVSKLSNLPTHAKPTLTLVLYLKSTNTH